MKPTIATICGDWHALEDPPLLVDIAHSLAMQCRFTGHLSSFYSVAQHSLWVMRAVRERGGSRREQLAALLHDASEAYLGDLAKPYKEELPDFKAAEARVQRICFKEFGLTIEDETTLVKQCDKLACFVEARDLRCDSMYRLFEGYAAFRADIDDTPRVTGCHDVGEMMDVKQEFINAYLELKQQEAIHGQAENRCV